ncbi:hypothetical protein HZH66_003551 [Vespula vulgaris]|uniref:Uncharacterized protein n=1 Tax=Vespula vulgaris TaxID=7454 RepID=A0A834ND66_VESVU|nr:hypothetical protein HZH66_003551 [Vespula vulgaris]
MMGVQSATRDFQGHLERPLRPFPWNQYWHKGRNECFPTTYRNIFGILHKWPYLGSYWSDSGEQDRGVEGGTRGFQRHRERPSRWRNLGDNRT